MSMRKLDEQGRFRSYTTAFRMSPEEHEELNKRVELSGLTKQDYMIKKALDKEVVITGNMRTFRTLRNHINSLVNTLEEYIMQKENVDNEIMIRIECIVEILKGLADEEETLI